MSRRWLLSLFCLAVPLLLFVQLTGASGVLRVNEADTRFLLGAENPRVSLVVENSTGKSITGMIRLELLDPTNHVRSWVEPTIKIKPGQQKLLIDLPLKMATLDATDQEQLLWYRLRYHVVSEPAAAIEPVDGVIALSEITPELFEIRVASSRFGREGVRYRATVRAQHPLTRRPARNVLIEGTIQFEGGDTSKKSSLHAAAETDHDGFALLDFDLPKSLDQDEIELTVKAERGSLTAAVKKSIELSRKPYIFVTTDKPIYQPGQVLHARVLCFRPSKRALANIATTLKISDPDDGTVFQTELKTSRFGIASADWTIPANTRLGEYKIEFSLDDDKSNSTSIKISRYDLPNFTVNVKPDRTYYLPSQNAEVEVTAAYLFGQPVQRGHLRLVRESERTWNYRKQLYETKEAEKYEGETDANGSFKLQIDLSKEQADLDDKDYERFRDLSYAAYFTDPTTNRTEQRRFDLRITKQAIHVYVIKAHDNYFESSGLPLQFYLTTYYADGTPAQCRVAISDVSDNKNEVGRQIRSVRTNRLGVAKIDRFEVPRHAADSGDLTLNFLASDSHGEIGKHAEAYDLRDDLVLHVETDKTLYRPGDPIAVTITASERQLTAMLEVRRGWITVHSEVVKLRDGQAVVTLPWNAEYKDELTIASYADLGEHGAFDSHTILFPHNRELKLGLRTNHETYRPGTDGQLSFRVRDPQGRFAEGALSVVVFDKAVAERARTDQEFGAGYHDAYRDLLSWFGEGDWIAGLGRMELDKIDLSRPLAPEVELAAEIALNQNRSYYPSIFGGDDYEKSSATVFGESSRKQIKPVGKVLHAHYELTREYPANEQALLRILSAEAIDYRAIRDPWGEPYRPTFLIDKQFESMTLTSSGPDKRFGTEDDFIVDSFRWFYFRSTGEAIDLAVKNYAERTGGFIRDRNTLRDELRRSRIELDSLVDRWSRPYRVDFAVQENQFVIKVWSAGPNGRFEDEQIAADDFELWASTIDYFAPRRSTIDTALAAELNRSNHFPETAVELRDALKAAGLTLENLRDPWGNTYYSVFSVQKVYADHATIESFRRLGEAPGERLEIKPVTQSISLIKLRSAGPDGKEGTADDFDAGVFSATLAEQSGSNVTAQVPRITTSFSGATGAIGGFLTDVKGGLIPGATVRATRLSSTQVFQATTDDEGKYVLQNLPVGVYTVRIESNGFKSYVVDNILVRSSNLIEVNAILDVGAVTEMVTVTSSSAQPLQADSSTASMTASRVVVFNGAVAKHQVATPRPREYFPETLVWLPSLETDKQGRALVNFKLADNITTWKVAVFGSTEDGQIGTVEKEIKAFQPFFVEHDPPRVLTEGDEISLPVVVRNYLERAQTVDLEIKPETWFALLGPAHKRAEVGAGNAVRETFDFRASASIKDGRQRITASAAQDNDAIEKPVTVHPDGEETTRTTSDIVADRATLSLNIPATAIANSQETELKIYPNLMAHVIEGVEGIMERPYGCGEQTISSTYPSLLLVRQASQTGQEFPRRAQAGRYLQAGYDRLLNYRDESGGFTYWGRGEPDVALTAYALRFLTEARDLITVDADIVDEALAWLGKQQRPDGSWEAYEYGKKFEDKRRTALLTAYVARVLAATQRSSDTNAQRTVAPKKGKSQKSPNLSPDPSITSRRALKRGFDYLSQRVNEIDEPYLLASYALAALDAGDAARAVPAIERLRGLAHSEGNATYWALETNTPFYGWGLAGRVETTALVIQALARSAAPSAVTVGSRTQPTPIEVNNQSLTPSPNLPQSIASGSQPPSSATPAPAGIANLPAPAPPANQTNDPLIRSGLLFLLKHKDRYGVWYSTQATINVFDALLASLKRDGNVAANYGPDLAEIFINGRAAQKIQLPPPSQLVGPIILNISQYMNPGDNSIDLRRVPGSSLASAQLVATYYLPWSAPGPPTEQAASVFAATMDAPGRSGDVSKLRLQAKFDKTRGIVGEEITCHVEAERIGLRGYGMLLAEIGLPPGADVDRATLDTAMKSSGWEISQYDILPDRVVVYLWPPAGGVKFDFKFRPRFGMNAKAAPSLIYDYYNPDARAVVAPVLFAIR